MSPGKLLEGGSPHASGNTGTIVGMYIDAHDMAKVGMGLRRCDMMRAGKGVKWAHLGAHSAPFYWIGPSTHLAT